MPNFFTQKSIEVFNGDMIQLKPVSPGKARILLKKKKAKIICTSPVILRLNYRIQSKETKT